MLRDLYFVVAKDFINKQLKGYNDLLPIKAYSQIVDRVKRFLTTFEKPDGSQYEISTIINLLTYKADIEFEHQIKEKTVV